jgi:threonine/homoserine/homoserine lactone efflux protein
MLFVMAQTVRRGWRSGAAALGGMQLGYLGWWVLAALGLGVLAAAFPLAFRLLGAGGALYLAWLGIKAIRHAGAATAERTARAGQVSRHTFRDGVLVAIGNPKALLYVVALLPPFVVTERPILPQLGMLAVVGATLDVIAGTAYIYAGSRLARAMERPGTRIWIDRGVGTVLALIALAILAELLLR